MTTPRTGIIDHHLGNKLRVARIAYKEDGLSQDELARQVGITFQQIQKYEKGLNRISASRLYWFTKILGVNFEFFFNGVESIIQQDAQISDKDVYHSDETVNFLMNIDLESKETLSLLRAYYSIKDMNARSKVLSLLKLIDHSDSTISENNEFTKQKDECVSA